MISHNFMRYVLLFILFPYLIFCNLNGNVILHCRPGAGMFSVWMDVLALVTEYEKGNYEGIEVNLNGGAYFDSEYGHNWWQYYCEPIREGSRNDPQHVIGNPPGVNQTIENRITRHQAKELIDKYIHIKPEIIKICEDFQNHNFIGKVLTVHYRGTDKETEVPRVPYQKVYDEIIKVIGEKEITKIFIATDEQSFLEYMLRHFGSMICYTHSIRTNGNVALHHSELNRYQLGLESIIDMVLLSKGNYLIRTSSNLSRWSTWFNPDICVRELSYFNN